MIIVDDCETNCRILRTFCEANGFEVLITLYSADDILEEYEHRKPDVIIMDYFMSGKDGITATKELTTKYPEAKVVLFSAMGLWDDQTRAKESGAIGFIQKPLYMNLMNFIRELDI